jgi:hypothetical protein
MHDDIIKRDKDVKPAATQLVIKFKDLPATDFF